MDILLLTSRFERGGIGEVIFNESLRLARNHHVTVASLRFSRPLPAGASALRLDVPRIRAGDYDILHYHGHSPMFALRTVLSPHPFIVTHHGILPDAVVRPRSMPVHVIMRQFMIQTVRSSSIAIGVAKSLVEELRKWKAKKTTLLYNGVDCETFKPLSNSLVDELRANAYPVLLFVGSLQPVRGIEDLILALPTLVKRYPRIRFLVVGHSVGEYTHYLRCLTSLLKVEKYVHFAGYVPHEQLPSYYNACDLFVFPSLTYQLGLGVLEAIACGKPVLMRDKDDQDADYLVQRGMSFVFRERNQLPEIIERSISTRNQDASAKCVSFARSLDWDRHVERLLDIYTKSELKS